MAGGPTQWGSAPEGGPTGRIPVDADGVTHSLMAGVWGKGFYPRTPAFRRGRGAGELPEGQGGGEGQSP